MFEDGDSGREIIKQFVKNKVNVWNKESKLFAREIKVFTAYHAVTRNQLIYGRSWRGTFAISPLKESFAFWSGKFPGKCDVNVDAEENLLSAADGRVGQSVNKFFRWKTF